MRQRRGEPRRGDGVQPAQAAGAAGGADEPAAGVEGLVFRYPVAVFLAAAFVWGFMFFRAGTRIQEAIDSQVPGSAGQAANVKTLRMVTAVGSMGPMVSCFMVLAFLSGEAGINVIFQRFVHPFKAWWLWLLCVIPVAASDIVFEVWRHMGEGGDQASGAALQRMILPALGVGLEWAIAEEVAWRGWLLPTLLRKGFTPLQGALLVGLVAAGWHALPWVAGLNTVGRAAGAALFPVAALTAIPLSLLHTYMQLRSRGNMALAFALHIVAVGSALVFSQPMRVGKPTHQLFFGILETVALNVLVLPVFIALARQSAGIQRSRAAAAMAAAEGGDAAPAEGAASTGAATGTAAPVATAAAATAAEPPAAAAAAPDKKQD